MTCGGTQCRLDFRGNLRALEDYPAHSNFCELCLVSITDVFTHVGDAVSILAPDESAPVVTGKFFSWTTVQLGSEVADVRG